MNFALISNTSFFHLTSKYWPLVPLLLSLEEFMQPLVSILIPAHNAKQWIDQTVTSALNQTWSRKEIIVVDDGSSDGTSEVLKGYASLGVVVIRQKNGGGGAARNTALSIAKGDYIQWLDHDDLLAPDKISLQMQEALTRNDPLTLYSGRFSTFFFCEDRATMVENSMCKDLTPVEYFLSKFMEDAWLQIGAYLFSRELVDKTGPWKSTQSTDDDGDYLARTVAACSGIRFVNDALSYWRIGNVSSAGHHNTARTRRVAWETAFHCIDLLLGMEDSERTRTACLRFLQLRLARYSYPEEPEAGQRLEEMLKNFGPIDESTTGWKYTVIRKLLGQHGADTIKGYSYKADMIIKRNVDKLFLRRSPKS